MATRTAVVIGCGKRGEGKVGWAIGHAHGVGWLAADPSVRLLGVDLSPENLAAFGERFKLPKENLFSSTDALYAALTPDFVSVCTWPGLHAPMTIEAAKRGVKGVVCEKPMALNVGQMKQMTEACAASGTRLTIAHQRRYNATFGLARKLLHEGAIGDAWVFEGRVGDDWDVLSWTVHWFDMANFFFDGKPQWVLAGADHTGERRYGHAVENASTIFAQYDHDRQAIFVTGPAGYGITVRGSKGMIRIAEPAVHVYNESGYHVHQPVAGAFEDDYGRLMKELIGAAGTDKPILCGVENCAAGTEIAYAAHESARTMRKVSLPLDTLFAPLEIVQQQPRLALPAGKVALLADEHFGSGGREGITEAITALTGEVPMQLDARQSVTQAALSGVGLLVMYHTQADADETTRSTIKQWVESGRPLLLLHAALGAWPKWEEYGQWAGRVWAWGENGSEHPHEASELCVIDEKFTRLSWQRAKLPMDEVFIKLAQRAPVRDVVNVTIPQGTFPAAWISASKPNVGVWVPGHRRDLWQVPAMRQGLAAMAQAISSNVAR